eukprot:13004725-Alexandrium_andersonii.AAC.1
MSASLVGSEMCIRDSTHIQGVWESLYRTASLMLRSNMMYCKHALGSGVSVSYTHLTLPTICSV